MANEISINATLSVTNGNLKISENPGQKQVSQATARGGNPGTVNVGTSEEVLSFGDLVAPGWCLMRNLDSVNYVEIGPVSGGAMIPAWRLKAGEYCLVRLVPTATYRGKANTDAVNVRICVLDD